MNDLEQRVRTCLQHVADSTPVPVHPRSVGVRPRRSRRWLITGALGLGLLGAGGGLAVAGGSPFDAFGYNGPGAYSAKPDTERQLLVTKGPNGQPLVVTYADASDNGYCVKMSRPGESTPADPAVYGGGCSGPVGGQAWRRFGGEQITLGGSLAAGQEAVTLYAVHVPNAATVNIVFADGSAVSTPLTDHWTAGYLSADEGRRKPVLVGYDSAGHEVGTAPILGVVP